MKKVSIQKFVFIVGPWSVVIVFFPQALCKLKSYELMYNK